MALSQKHARIEGLKFSSSFRLQLASYFSHIISNYLDYFVPGSLSLSLNRTTMTTRNKASCQFLLSSFFELLPEIILGEPTYLNQHPSYLLLFYVCGLNIPTSGSDPIFSLLSFNFLELWFKYY